MKQSPRYRNLILVLVIGLVPAACGSDDGTETTADGMEVSSSGDHTEEYEFGEPMEAGDATRVVEITANDDFTFDPTA